MAELADVQQPLNALLELDEDAEVGVVDDLALERLAEEVTARGAAPRVLGQLLDAQAEALAQLVDLQDLGLDLVALLVALGGVTDPLRPGQVADVDQPVDAILDADEDAEVGDVADLALQDRADRVVLLDEIPGVVLELLHAEADALLVQVDVEHDGLDLLAHVHELARVLDALVPGHLGDVDQPLDALLELDEGAVVRHGDDLALHHRADRVAIRDVAPGILAQLLVAEADALGLSVELEDADLHLVADLEDLRRVVDPTPAHVRDVEQAVDAAQIDERTVVGDVLDRAVDDGADLDLLERLAAPLAPLLLQEDPAGQHDVAATLVELDDLELGAGSDEPVQVLDGPQVDLRAGQERLDADVDGQAALDAGHDGALDDLVVVHGLLDLVPGLHQVGLLLGEDELTVGALERLEVDLDLVADSDAEGSVLGRFLVAELPLGDHAFRLVVDVDDDVVVRHADDRALDDLALLDGLVADDVLEEPLELRGVDVCGVCRGAFEKAVDVRCHKTLDGLPSCRPSRTRIR